MITRSELAKSGVNSLTAELTSNMRRYTCRASCDPVPGHVVSRQRRQKRTNKQKSVKDVIDCDEWNSFYGVKSYVCVGAV